MRLRSGPLSRKGMAVGYIGTTLHTICWILAVAFDGGIIPGMIDAGVSPAAWALCLYGLITLCLAFTVCFSITLWHLLGQSSSKIPEGGAPPFVMTLMIGGVQIAAVFAVVNLILAGSDTHGAYTPVASDKTLLAGTEEGNDKTNEFRAILIWGIIFKLFVVQFLQNNQVWAGPAALMRDESAL